MGDVMNYVSRCDDSTDYKLISISDYVNYVKSCGDAIPYYMSDSQFHKNTELEADYSRPEYFKNWYEDISEDFPDEEKPYLKPSLSWIYIGPAKSYSALHQDVWNTSAWNAVISGKKLWLFFPVSQSDYLYKGAVNPFSPDLDKYPYYARTRPFFCIQNPGEIVFTPGGWWHTVINLEAGLSLTENFINNTNIHLVVEEFRRRKMLKYLSIYSKYFKII